MKMREYLQKLYLVFSSDETLLRLLTYLPKNAADNPLSEEKSNILDMPDEEFYEHVDSILKFTPTYNGIDDQNPICRMFFYNARRSNTSNYAIADQKINIDIFVHHKFNDVDLRLSWLCDYVNDLMFDKRVAGMGKVRFDGGRPTNSPEGYIAYSLTYEIGSSKR